MKEIQIFRNEIQAGRKRFQIRRNEIQMKSLHFLRGIEPSQMVRRSPTAFFFWADFGPKGATAAQALLVRFGLFLVPSVFVSVPPVS
jgi:hypothetical protein